MKELTRRQALVAGCSGLIAGPSMIAISCAGGPTDGAIAAAIESFHELEQRSFDAAGVADEASIALHRKREVPPWSVRKYMSKSAADLIYRWPSGNFIAIRVLAESAMTRPPDDPQRICSGRLLAAAEAYERQCAIPVQPCDFERLRTEEEAAYRLSEAALEAVIELPCRGLAAVVQKLQMADELGDLSEFEGPPLEEGKKRSDSARLFISAMGELVHLLSEG